jgi:glycosyltransferase involved in cell wall biosynthesis
MISNKKISIVIPAYKVGNHIKSVVDSIPKEVDFIVIVDDGCPSGSTANITTNESLFICQHEVNKGVGAAVVTGYKKSIELGADIVVKVDGDGQMDLGYLKFLLEPVLTGVSDYSKGNRFKDFNALKKMPKIRLFGNSVLSFMVKASSGYWNIMDPTNGYTAISKKSLLKLNLDSLAKRYFFESDMLINLNIANCVVSDVSIPAKYKDESSSLSVTKTIFEFPILLFLGLVKRAFYKYFVYDFNMASVYIIFGMPMTLFGFFHGSYSWYQAVSSSVEASTGTVMLSALPIILGMQFLLQAISIDIGNIPKK